MVSQVLSAPEIVRSYTEDGCDPVLPAFCLRWEDAGDDEHVWQLPEGVRMVGPAPTRFGVDIQRTGAQSYAVRLVWDHTFLSWPVVSRADLLTSSLGPLLSALGTDLWHLLDQPLLSAGRARPRAA